MVTLPHPICGAQGNPDQSQLSTITFKEYHHGHATHQTIRFLSG
jgi:hypothetical protein